MKKYILPMVLTLLFAVGTLSAQPNELWRQHVTYGDNNPDYGYSAVQTADGGFAVAGWTGVYGNLNEQFYLVRFAADGNVVWTQTYGGAGTEQCHALIVTSDGGFAMAGRTDPEQNGEGDSWLVKTDANGDMEWNSVLNWGGNEICNALVQNADGGFALAGSTISEGGTSDFMFIVTDSNGDMTFRESFSSGDHGWGIGNETCYSIVQTADGGWALAGESPTFGQGNMWGWLLRLNSDHEVVWDHYYGSVYMANRFLSLIITSDGGFALGGMSGNGGNFWFVKTDDEGNSQWQQTYGGGGFEQCNSVLQTSDGGYALGGVTTSYGAGSLDMWIVKTEANGDQVWDIPLGGEEPDWCESLIQTSDGGYLLAGHTISFAADGIDMWAVRLAPEEPPPPHFSDFVQTDNTHIILVTDIQFGGESVPTGWEVGIFTPGGVLAGGGEWIAGERLGIAGFSDDELTDVVEGFVDGEQMSFRLWSPELETEYVGWWKNRRPDRLPVEARTMRWMVDGMSAISLTAYADRYYTEYIDTPRRHTLAIENVDFDLEPIPRGTEIACFTRDGGLAGSAVYDPDSLLYMNVNGDDPLTQEVEGFVDGEEMRFHLYDVNNRVEYSNIHAFSDVFVILSWADMELSTINLRGMSLNQFEDFTETRDRMTLWLTGINFEGERVPNGWEVGCFTRNNVLAGGQRWLNLDTAIPLFAYLDDPNTGPVEGLREGERMKFSLYDPQNNVEHRAFAVEIPRDRNGDGEIGEDELGGIADQAASGGLTSYIMLKGYDLDHFTDFRETLESHLVIVNDVTLDGEPASDGVEIGCFMDDGTLVGAGRWDGLYDFQLPLDVWEDDPSTEPVEGFVEGQRMHFRAWNPENNTEYRTVAWGDGSIFDIWGRNLTSELSLEVLDLRHFNDFIETDERHTLLLDRVNINGQPAPNGSEIAAFTPDGINAGACVWDDTDIPHNRLRVFGDIRGTDPVEGFVSGETITLRVWDSGSDTEYPALSFFDIFTEVSVAWYPDSTTTIGVEAFEIRTMNINLDNNWNLISINVVPSDPTLYAGDRGPEIVPMMAQFIDHLVLMKNERGRFYWPALHFNNIEFWNLDEGYLVKMNQAMQGSWTGVSIPASTGVPIELGWNFIRYTPTYQLGASQRDFYVVSPILENVLIAKNRAGQFMIPRNGFSNMAPWRESQGYQIKVNAPVVLNYPENEPGTDLFEPLVEAGNGHWNEPNVTGINMSVLISSIDGVIVKSGDQIAAFGANGTLVGVGNVQSDGKTGIAVWGDDLSTNAIDGLQNGEAFTLRLWNSIEGTELALETNINQGSLVYETDGFANLSVFASVSVPENFYISESYPNPFNSTTHIAFGLPEAGRLSIGVYDMAGRLVATLAEGEFAAGNHTAVWNADAAPAGLYMVKMQAGSFSEVRKLTLVK